MENSKEVLPLKVTVLESPEAPHARHYRVLQPEPIDVIERWQLNFNLGNALKYIARCEYKGQKIEDLEKAIWYLRRELAMSKD